MIRATGAAALLSLAFVMPMQQAQAQDILGGALLGGAAGAVIGGAATGRAGGAVAGGVIGAAAGAAIASHGERRGNSAYYWYEGRCWQRHPNGEYHRVSRRYCG